MLDEYDLKRLKAYQDKVSFLQDLLDLFDKYRVSELEVIEEYSHYQSYPKSVDINFTVKPDRDWMYISLPGRWIDRDDIQKIIIESTAELDAFETLLRSQ